MNRCLHSTCIFVDALTRALRVNNAKWRVCQNKKISSLRAEIKLSNRHVSICFLWNIWLSICLRYFNRNYLMLILNDISVASIWTLRRWNALVRPTTTCIYHMETGPWFKHRRSSLALIVYLNKNLWQPLWDLWNWVFAHRGWTLEVAYRPKFKLLWFKFSSERPKRGWGDLLVFVIEGMKKKRRLPCTSKRNRRCATGTLFWSSWRQCFL